MVGHSFISDTSCWLFNVHILCIGPLATANVAYSQLEMCTGKRVERRVLETEPLFCFHHVNAYETVEAASGRKERVILDCLAMKDGVDFGANFGNLSAEFFQHTPWRTAFTRLSLDPMQNTVRALDS